MSGALDSDYIRKRVRSMRGSSSSDQDDSGNKPSYVDGSKQPTYVHTATHDNAVYHGSGAASEPRKDIATVLGTPVLVSFSGDDESPTFQEFSFVTKAVITALGWFNPEQMQYLDSTAVAPSLSQMTSQEQDGANKLYLYLIMSTKSFALQVVREVEQGNGAQAWVALKSKYDSENLHQAVANLHNLLETDFSDIHHLQVRLQKFKSDVVTYRKRHGLQSLPDELLVAVVLRTIPEPLRTQLIFSKYRDFSQVEDHIHEYLLAGHGWKAIGKSEPSSVQMEIDALSKFVRKGAGQFSQPGQVGQKGLCWHFIRTGKCKYGDSCRFSHTLPKGVQILRETAKAQDSADQWGRCHKVSDLLQLPRTRSFG
eukprot:TRINITY_DN3817_c0_g1_i1.p1 TRINITY_DN3817_c0_g1~~TRINITY_DN3817_c0_g1_i1.p1  ORF type:complete len:368 (-),score=42.44 TRINITY_DN3817_c0_g1_i1:967-2070(-)